MNPDKFVALQIGFTAIGLPLQIPVQAEARFLGVWFRPLGVSYKTWLDAVSSIEWAAAEDANFVWSSVTKHTSSSAFSVRNCFTFPA